MPAPKDPIKHEEWINKKNSFKKGNIPYNKGTHITNSGSFKKDNRVSPTTEFKKGEVGYWQDKKRPEISGENHYNYSGGKKLSKQRVHNKRRELGNNFLNKTFPNSCGHHVNLDDVIHVPEDYNKISHNVRTGRNMEIVNALAYFFLLQQNIKEFSEA